MTPGPGLAAGGQTMLGTKSSAQNHIIMTIIIRSSDIGKDPTGMCAEGNYVETTVSTSSSHTGVFCFAQISPLKPTA